MEVFNTVHEAVTKTISKKKKSKKAKLLSQEAMKIVEKRREVKGKEEKERYTQLNADFQTIARRNKNTFLSVQCKEIEKNNRMKRAKSSRKLEITKDYFMQRWAQ